MRSLPVGEVVTRAVLLAENPVNNTRNYHCVTDGFEWVVPMDDTPRPVSVTCPECDDSGRHDERPVFLLADNARGVFHDT